MATYTQKRGDGTTVTYSQQEWNENSRREAEGRRMTAIAIANEWSARGKRWLYIWWPLIILALAGVVELNDSTINSQEKSYWSMGLLNTFYMVILAPICLALLFFVTF